MSGPPPDRLRAFETVDGDPSGVLVRPAGSIAHLRSGSSGWINTRGNERSWLELSGLVVTPEMYGAVGDGVADDTVAVAAAVADIGSRGGGELFCAKRYLLSSQIVVPDRVMIRGVAGMLGAAGGSTPIPGPSVFLTAQLDCSFFRLGHSCGVSGVRFDVQNDGVVPTSGAIIDASDRGGISIERVVIRRCFQGIRAHNAVHFFNGIQARELEINAYVDAAFSLHKAVGVYISQFQFVNSTYYAASIGIRATDGTATLDVSDGTIWGGQHGVVVVGGASGSQETCADDIHLSNFDVDFCQGAGCKLSGMFHSTLEGLWVGACGSNGIEITGEGQGLSIQGCSVLCNYYAGISLYSTAFPMVMIRGNMVHSNNRADVDASGIYVLDGAKRFVISGNESTNTSIYGLFAGYQRYGIRIGAGSNPSDNYVVEGNLVSGNQLGGVLDNGTGASKYVEGNV